MFLLVRIIFQCALMISDMRHYEIINLIRKLNKFSTHFVTIIDLKGGTGNHIYNQKLIFSNFCKYPQ